MILPRLPGTRAIYKTRGSRFGSAGFLGYLGGFPAIAVNDERELASTGAACILKDGYSK